MLIHMLLLFSVVGLDSSEVLKSCLSLSALAYNPVETDKYQTILTELGFSSPNTFSKDDVGLVTRSSVNEAKKLVVIAARGTVPNLKENLFADLGIIIAALYDYTETGMNKQKIFEHFVEYLIQCFNEVQPNHFSEEDRRIILNSIDDTSARFTDSQNEVIRKARKLMEKIPINELSEKLYRPLDRIIKEFVDCVRNVKDSYSNEYNFILTGHSLGGFLAEFAGHILDIQSLSINAPGGAYLYFDRWKQIQIYDGNRQNPIKKIYRARGDIVSNHGRHMHNKVHEDTHYIHDQIGQNGERLFIRNINLEHEKRETLKKIESSRLISSSGTSDPTMPEINDVISQTKDCIKVQSQKYIDEFESVNTLRGQLIKILETHISKLVDIMNMVDRSYNSVKTWKWTSFWKNSPKEGAENLFSRAIKIREEISQRKNRTQEHLNYVKKHELGNHKKFAEHLQKIHGLENGELRRKEMKLENDEYWHVMKKTAAQTVGLGTTYAVGSSSSLYKKCIIAHQLVVNSDFILLNRSEIEREQEKKRDNNAAMLWSLYLDEQQKLLLENFKYVDDMRKIKKENTDIIQEKESAFTKASDDLEKACKHQGYVVGEE